MRAWLALVLLFGACASSPELPPLNAEAGGEPDGSDPLADDPVRRELRRLFDRCEATRAELQADVDRARARHATVAAGAAVAWLAGEIADDDGPDVGAQEPGAEVSIAGAGACSNDSSDPTAALEARCSPPQVPSTTLGRGSPVERQTTDVRVSAADRIDDINAAIDATDELLFSHPDPAAWGEDERSRWRSLRARLETECTY